MQIIFDSKKTELLAVNAAVSALCDGSPEPQVIGRGTAMGSLKFSNVANIKR